MAAKVILLFLSGGIYKINVKVIMRTLMQQQIKFLFIGIAGLLLLTFSCSQNVKNDSTVKGNSTMTTGGNERLLTVITLNEFNDGTTIEVTFLESPAVFEFSLVNTQSSQMYQLLSDSKAKQLPVNVFIGSEQNRNIIRKVLPAKDEQMENYLREKSSGRSATPVPKPD